MPESIVSVLLTCGRAEHFHIASDTKYKALLPLNGRPVVDYVAQTLCNSQIEKLFVVQCRDEGLERILQNHEKIIFISCEIQNPTLSDSIFCSIEGLLNYYGADKLDDKYIMYVPCDIPSVKPQDFNALISQVKDYDIDLYTTFIDNKLLRKWLPERHFRSGYFYDLGGDFSEQGINFVRGRLFGMETGENGMQNIVIYGHDKQKLPGLSEIINDFRNSRHNSLSLMLFFTGFIFKSLVFRGCIGITARFVYNWLSRRLTLPFLEEILYKSLYIKVGLLRSESVAFSADIDKPADFCDVERLMQQANPS
jgi:CTP:molybdopterin cytidylyltransferase MocA